MAITKATASSVAPAAKGDLVVGSATNDASILAVGTNDYVLTAASGEATGLKWAAAAGGANWSLFNAGGTALTAATTITVSGISGKDKIMILVQGASSTSSNQLIGVRLNTDTGSNYYSFGADFNINNTYTPAYFSQTGGADSLIRLAYMANNVASIVSGYVLLSGCNSSGVKVFNSVGSANAPSSSYWHEPYMIGGYYNSASTISSVSVNCNSGTFDAGTVYIYTSA